MASATPSATPEVVSTKKFDSPFNSRSLVITVGPTQKPFTIHEAKLAETCFFDVHGEPTKRDDNRSRLSRTRNREANDDPEIVEVKLEDGSIELVRSVEADYHLEDRFLLDPPAFDTFAKYLYNEPPKKPSSHKQLRTLSKAYGIATKYKCYGLQNRILECIRQYYGHTQIRLDDLVWCINRYGDNTTCPLTAYMVEQVAFEIAHGGFQEYCHSNILMAPFLEQGDRANTAGGDPSTGRSKFLVNEKGEHAGELRQ